MLQGMKTNETQWPKKKGPTIARDGFIWWVICMKEEMFLETFIVLIILPESIMSVYARQLQ